jgi:glucose-6-phosphate isomerase
MSIFGQFVSKQVPSVDWPLGRLEGANIRNSITRLGQLNEFFQDRAALAAMDLATVVYRVQWWEPIAAGVEGGLFWGATTIEPGRVGDEYFMTKGHFHAIRNRAEYYAGVRGEGMLILMDEQRRTRAEVMSPRSLHYIPGATAHRVVNTGQTALCFWACWPSDAGHDYETIQSEGFSARVLESGGQPVLVKAAEMRAAAER